MKRIILAAAVVLAAGAASAATTHTVVAKDCLWNLAQTYYHNPFRWQAIHAANTDKIKDPHWIYPGQVLVIPDLPEPEVGELPARPVETGATPTEVPAEPEQAAAPEPAPEPAPAAEPPAQAEQAPDGLHNELPAGQVGYASTRRLKAPASWKADGAIVVPDGELDREPAEGESVQARLVTPAQAGDQFAVYRKGGAFEGEDEKAQYFEYVGVLRVEKPTGKSQYRLTVVKSVDTVQQGDVLKRLGS